MRDYTIRWSSPSLFISFTHSQNLNHNLVPTFFLLHSTSRSHIRHHLQKDRPGDTVSHIPSDNSKFTQGRWWGGNLLQMAKNAGE